MYTREPQNLHFCQKVYFYFNLLLQYFSALYMTKLTSVGGRGTNIICT